MPSVSGYSLFSRVLMQSEITTVFQPIFNLMTEEILGYEALSRGPKGSELESPESLFALALAVGKISELELLCRKMAIKNFSEQGLSGKLFLNVSPKVLLDVNHPKGETLYLLKQYELDPNRIVIEVTEQEKIHDSELFKKTIKHYRKLGFTIAIDDLGVGYSGLKQWSELEPDIVKIDRYFIENCHSNIVKRIFLNSIVELAKATNTKVIAEGIEQIEELNLLTSIGINLVQGYLLAKPTQQPVKLYQLPVNYSIANYEKELKKEA